VNTRDMLWATLYNGYKLTMRKNSAQWQFNNNQTGIDPFIELPHEACHCHKNNRAAGNAKEAERSPRHETCTRAHTPTLGGNQTERKDYRKE